jgi:3-oxoacyl-[acyl-carrier protein] reductase
VRFSQQRDLGRDSLFRRGIFWGGGQGSSIRRKETAMRLERRVAIVTGAARGLGKAYALRLAEEGARVLIADVDLKGAEATAAEIEAKGGSAFALRVDVSSAEDTRRMAEEAIARFGRIDILVNNAALMASPLKMRPFWEIDPQEWDRVMAVNVKGPWLCACAVVPQMKKQGKGKIINISSTRVFEGSPMLCHYNASKAAVIGLTRVLARELGEYGICVNTVAPGLVPTEGILSLVPESYAGKGMAKQCFKRVQTPEDLVGTIAFLASDDSDFLTGQTISVDGGRVML